MAKKKKLSLLANKYKEYKYQSFGSVPSIEISPDVRRIRAIQNDRN